MPVTILSLTVPFTNTAGTITNSTVAAIGKGAETMVVVAVFTRLERKTEKRQERARGDSLFTHKETGGLCRIMRRHSALLQPAPGEATVKSYPQPQRWWRLDMSYHSLNEWTETDKQATFSSRLRWRFHSAAMTSNDRYQSELINGVLVYFYQGSSTINNLFVTLRQSSATKILTRGDGRKWGDHRGHKSSLRHTSSKVWFTQTIDTATASGHSHICLSCGSR